MGITNPSKQQKLESEMKIIEDHLVMKL